MKDFKKFFLDSTPLIYFLDRDPNFGEKTAQIISYLIDNEKYIASSIISATEYLIYPYRTGNDAKVKAFLEIYIRQLYCTFTD